MMRETSARGAVSTTSCSAIVAPAVNRRQAQLEGLPPAMLEVKEGFNCVVIAKVGTGKFRVTLDIGAARSIARSSFAAQLRKNKATKDSTYGPRPMSRHVCLERVSAGSTTSAVKEATQIGLGLTDIESGHDTDT